LKVADAESGIWLTLFKPFWFSIVKFKKSDSKLSKHKLKGMHSLPENFRNTPSKKHIFLPII
jgi:hypothetical protein